MARLDGQRFTDLALSIFATIREAKFDNETYIDAFIRLIGLRPNATSEQAQTLTADQSIRTQDKLNSDASIVTGQAGETIVDGLLKSSREDTIQVRRLCAAYLQSLLHFIKRWSRLERGQQKRRLERLVGNNPALANQILSTSTGILSEVSLFQTEKGAKGLRGKSLDVTSAIQKVNDALKQIELSGVQPLKPLGKLTLQLSLHEAIVTQLESILGTIPVSRLGELGGEFAAALKTAILGTEQEAKRLFRQRQSVLNELIRLGQQEQLITDGTLLETGETLSLRNFIQGLTYLCGIEYTCKNCAFFQQAGEITESLGVTRETQGTGNICSYSFENGTGRATEPDFSCREVWGLINNDYWTASVEIVTEFMDEFAKELEGQ